MKACFVSFFMDNIDPKTVGLQKSVVEKYNKSKHHHYLMKINMPVGVAYDYFWSLNGHRVETTFNKDYEIKQQFDYDVVVFLDIDAIPLNEDALDYYVQKAADGFVVGNAQRSNHIENDQHVFAAPSLVAMSAETFTKMGNPSARETPRSDVTEEYTYMAELFNVPVDLIMPVRYDSPPIRYGWETDTRPYWPLADGMPVYGIGTTYGKDGVDMSYHNFQIRIEGQQERFWKKCEEVLNG